VRNNDWQKLYKLTEGVGADALFAMGTLRMAQKAGHVSSGELAAALAGGNAAVSELLTILTEAQKPVPAQFVEFIEDFGTVELQEGE